MTEPAQALNACSLPPEQLLMDEKWRDTVWTTSICIVFLQPLQHIQSTKTVNAGLKCQISASFSFAPTLIHMYQSVGVQK